MEMSKGVSSLRTAQSLLTGRTIFKRGDLSSVNRKRLTTSLVVTCDSDNFLLGNHMKCFNKVIFSKLMFSVKVMM